MSMFIYLMLVVSFQLSSAKKRGVALYNIITITFCSSVAITRKNTKAPNTCVLNYTPNCFVEASAARCTFLPLGLPI